MTNKTKINILVTLNEAYVPYLNVMLSSLIYNNQDCFFDIYLLHTSIHDKAMEKTRNIIGQAGNLIMVEG